MNKNKENDVQEAIRLYGNSHDGTIDSITSSVGFSGDILWLLVAAAITVIFAILIIAPSTKNLHITYQSRLGALAIIFITNTIAQVVLTGAFGMYLYVNWETVWHILNTINYYISFR